MRSIYRLGLLSGIFGAALCLLSGLLRLTGNYWLGNFQVSTLLLAGTASMVFGCFCLLVTLCSRDT